MYIFDCLYGQIQFSKKMIQCMLTPEMQRLREVRLGNINSIFLTGSANINRFEHSVGTAYLAQVNEKANKKTFLQSDNETFIYAALFHDLANGPFGHSYEYIVEKQGFVPEESIGDVLLSKQSGSHGKRATFEPFYLGQTNEIRGILSRREILNIDEIVKGDNPNCSKILSDVIDIDNIDNVYRMAYHMGIKVDKEYPVRIAEGIICKDNRIVFKASAVPYLFDWYEKRSQVYQFLLYNPHDFAAKCMMAEIMEIVLKHDAGRIKWQYTDSELIESIRQIKEEYWENLYIPVQTKYKITSQLGEQLKNADCAKEVLVGIGVPVPDTAKVTLTEKDEGLLLEFYNTQFLFSKGMIYKNVRSCLNPSKLVTRLMRGDLYACIGIFVSTKVERYDDFINGGSRRCFEEECLQFIENKIGIRDISIAFHAILDKNKTNRKLEIEIESGELLTIGENTKDLLIGAFIRNVSYGLSRKTEIPESKRIKLSSIINEFLVTKGLSTIEHKLYSEVKCVE